MISGREAGEFAEVEERSIKVNLHALWSPSKLPTPQVGAHTRKLIRGVLSVALSGAAPERNPIEYLLNSGTVTDRLEDHAARGR